MIGMIVLATSSLFGMSLNKLNTASKADLMEINGIGEKKADAIIKERRKGKFKSFEDFQRVDGIGKETAKNLKNDVKMKKEPKSTKKSSKKKSDKKSTKSKSSTKKTTHKKSTSKKTSTSKKKSSY